MKKIIGIVLLTLSVAGCASLFDAPKNIAGFSTRDMETARTKSIFQVYSCEFSDCFASVLDVARKNKYSVFMKDEIRGLIVLMGIPGVVDTTEVGVFLTNQPRSSGVKVELSSRSSPAKRAVAMTLFSELSQKYPKN